MRKINHFLALSLLSVIWANPLYAIEKRVQDDTQWVQLTDCVDKNLGISIKCSPEWSLEIQPRGLYFLVSEEPERIVTVKISKSDEAGLKWSDLKPSVLKDIYGYDENFTVSKSRIGNKRVLKVEARLADYPDIQTLDYFFINDSRLYRVSCTVNSYIYYEKFKPFFNELISTFDFFDSTESMVTYRHDPKH